MESIYSKRIRAGKRRTYFFDVRTTRGNDYYLTITESRKRFDDNGYDRHKIFLYKEDFKKFIKALGEAVDYVKTDLMPDFDFDAAARSREQLSEKVHRASGIVQRTRLAHGLITGYPPSHFPMSMEARDETSRDEKERQGGRGRPREETRLLE